MEAIAKIAKSKVQVTELIPYLTIIFSFLILSNEVRNGLCYNKAVFDGVVFLLAGMAMIRNKEWNIALILILLCCFTAYVLYFFPTHVSDFDIPSIVEVTAFVMFVVSFSLRAYAKWFGALLFVASALIFLFGLLDIQSPMLQSYSVVVAFLFFNLGCWLMGKH